MTIAELIYQETKALPEPMAREVLDFIGYLKERPERAEWRDLMNAQTSGLKAAWDNGDDQAWDHV